MLSVFRSRWVLASVTTLLYWTANHMLVAYIPIRMNELNATDLEIGVAVAGRALLPFLFAVWVGRISDRLGGYRLLMPSAAVMAVIGPLQAAAVTPVQFTLIQAVYGLATVGVWLALQAVVTHAGEGDTLRANLALFAFAWGLGMAVGPMLGAVVYDTVGFPALCWGYTGVTLAMVAAAQVIPWAQARAAERAAPAGLPFRSAISALSGRPAIRSVLLSSFVTHYIQSIRNSFYPVVLERNGFSVSQIGFLLSVFGVTSVVIRVVLPWILKQYGSGPVLIWSTWAGVVAITATPWLLDMVLLTVAAALVGCSNGLNPPITVELMARFTSPRERGISAGMRIMVNRFAQVVQPMVFGGLAAVAGTVAAFPASAVIMSGLTVSMARSTRHVREPAESG